MADAVKITNGPSKYDVMMSLFEQKEITFNIEHGEHVAGHFTMIVGAVSHRARYRQMEQIFWKFTGIPRDDFMLLDGTGTEPQGWDADKTKAFYIAYSPDRRRGVFSSVILDNQPTDPLRFPWGDLILASPEWRANRPKFR